MSVSESLVVGVIGISVVFLVLVGLIVLLRLQSALVNRFAQKKPAETVKEAAAEVPSSAPPAAEESSVPESADNSSAPAVPVSPLSNRAGTGVSYSGNGKFTVTVDDVAYEVEMEDEGAPLVIKTVETVQSAPAPAPQPAPKPAPAPQPKPKPAPAPAAAPSSGGKETITAPVPGTVLDIKATVGATVKGGDVLMLLEAMKMENEIVATKDGTVSQIMTTKGATVEAGAPLVEIQ